MKKFTALLLFAALLAAFPAQSFALNKSVTSVSATASTILTASQYVRTVVIQNTGSGDVRLGLDGGTTQGTPDPTSTTGMLLKAGTFIILTYPGNYKPPVIRAILTSGTTTTISVVTDDTIST